MAQGSGVDFLFEISWEVCNKVGGIYTVIKSKAQQMQEAYGEHYVAIGPYNPSKAAYEFVRDTTPPEFKEIFEELIHEGIACFYGKWNIKGKPNTILIDVANFMQNSDGIKAHLWETFSVDSLKGGADYTEPLVWSWGVGKLLEKISKRFHGKTIVAHCHEWLSGAAILYIKDKKVKAGTVFTTHATILGRSIASSGQPLYDMLGKFDPLQKAKELNIEHKFSLEAASAKHSDVFTTVSEITGLEAQHILSRKPDVLLPNGLDFNKFPDLEQIPSIHKKFKARIKEFVIPFLFPYGPFDIDNSLFFFTAGRYEYENKGIDVYIESLSNINKQLKKKKGSPNIVAFIFVPTMCQARKLEVIESKGLFEDLQDEIDDYVRLIRNKIISQVAQRKFPDYDELFDEDFIDLMKKHMISFKKEGHAPICTHEICDSNDRIMKTLKSFGLTNQKDDKVKVIFYPVYLGASDGLMDLDYYPALSGMHLGVFPSYYEPWGYTPLECAAYGVPSITTDLAGFGMFVKQTLKETKHPGIFIADRRGKKYEEVVKQVTKIMLDLATMPKNRRIENKLTAEHFSRIVDWKHLIDNYKKAHMMALKNGRTQKRLSA